MRARSLLNLKCHWNKKLFQNLKAHWTKLHWTQNKCGIEFSIYRNGNWMRRNEAARQQNEHTYHRWTILLMENIQQAVTLILYQWIIWSEHFVFGFRLFFAASQSVLHCLYIFNTTTTQYNKYFFHKSLFIFSFAVIIYINKKSQCFYIYNFQPREKKTNDISTRIRAFSPSLLCRSMPNSIQLFQLNDWIGFVKRRAILVLKWDTFTSSSESFKSNDLSNKP